MKQGAVQKKTFVWAVYTMRAVRCLCLSCRKFSEFFIFQKNFHTFLISKEKRWRKIRNWIGKVANIRRIIEMKIRSKLENFHWYEFWYRLKLILNCHFLLQLVAIMFVIHEIRWNNRRLTHKARGKTHFEWDLIVSLFNSWIIIIVSRYSSIQTFALLVRCHWVIARANSKKHIVQRSFFSN